MKDRVASSGSTHLPAPRLAKQQHQQQQPPPSTTPLPPPLARQQHRISLVHHASHSGAEPEDGHDHPSKASYCLSPLSPTFSEASSSSNLSSSSPVPTSRKYIRKEKIGQGAQGSVYRCIEVATGKELAVKIIRTHELSQAELDGIKHEVKTIKKLVPHRHLVEYYKATEKKRKQLSIYMEFVAGGSLSSKLRGNGALPLQNTKKYTSQLCYALQHLHLNRIAHRDIKCANIFLTSSWDEIKLGDFGAFKEIGCVSLVGGLKGTPHWMAPEVIRASEDQHEFAKADGWFKADIWSLGCAVVEMLTGHSPWQQYSNPLTAMYQIVSSDKTPSIPLDANEETSSFLKLCLQRNPQQRASIATLLKHPFVACLQDEDETAVMDGEGKKKKEMEPHEDQPQWRRQQEKDAAKDKEKQGEDSKKPPQEKSGEVVATTTGTTVTLRPRRPQTVDKDQQQHDDQDTNAVNNNDDARSPQEPLGMTSLKRIRQALPPPKPQQPATTDSKTESFPELATNEKVKKPVEPMDAPGVGPATATAAAPTFLGKQTVVPSVIRPSLRKPLIIPRLKPLELPQSPSNQEKESQDPPQPQCFSRGASASVLGDSARGRLDGKTTKSHSDRGIPITPIRLRRISTAPAPIRDADEILSGVPSHPQGHKFKLPPLSAPRPASSSSGG